MHKKTFNVDIDDQLSEQFSNQIEERGFTKYRAIEAAIRAFLVLPSEVQVALMSNAADAYSILLRGLVEVEIQKHLDDLGPAKEKFLALLRQAKAKGPRKK